MAEHNTDGEGQTDLAINTFNVRGIRDKIKRQRLFKHFKCNLKGIVCLQETYSVPGDLQRWQNEWGGDIYLSHGTSHSRGTAILIPKNYDVNITNAKIDENGRYIYLQGNINGHEIAILNLYAPTGDKQNEQIEFVNKIIPLVHREYHKTIVVGDLNTVLEPIDKFGNAPKISKYADKIKTYIWTCAIFTASCTPILKDSRGVNPHTMESNKAD